MSEEENKSNETTMSEEEQIMKLASNIKDAMGTMDDKHNIFTFSEKVIKQTDNRKIGFLRDDKEMNELGYPVRTVRGSLRLALISDKLMDNEYFKEYFEEEANITLATSLSRNAFLLRNASTQTKQIADITRRKKESKGLFGKKTNEEAGGDTLTA